MIKLDKKYYIAVIALLFILVGIYYVVIERDQQQDGPEAALVLTSLDMADDCMAMGEKDIDWNSDFMRVELPVLKTCGALATKDQKYCDGLSGDQLSKCADEIDIYKRPSLDKAKLDCATDNYGCLAYKNNDMDWSQYVYSTR